MDRERAAAQLRPRGAYEAIDFGFLLAREHYGQLVATLCLMTVPVATLMALVFPRQTAWLSLLLWWCKPVFERAIVFVLGRALFGDCPSIRETLAAFAAYGKRDWLLTLSVRRLSPTRSFDLPVTVLEQTSGRERVARLAVLHRGPFPSAAMMLTFVLAHVEVACVLGLVMLVGILTPEAFDWNVYAWVFDLESEASLGGQLFLYFVSLLAIILVAPFYVAGGFSLYLHRRTELEAWDLELGFRRLAERASSLRRGGARVNGLGTTIAVLGLATSLATCLASGLATGPATAIAPTPASAQEQTQRVTPVSAPEQTRLVTPDSARESIGAILESEAFHRTETLRIPKWLLDWTIDAKDGADSPFLDRLSELADAVSALVGGGLEIAIVTLALGAIAWLVIRLSRQRGLFGLDPEPTRRRRSGATELFGLQVTEQSLPEDLVTVAREAARSGDPRGALALLYRGALARLALVYGAELSKGVTEQECLDLARPLLPGDGTLYLDRLTRSWLRCAYGHREPDSSGLEGLFGEWPRWFGLEASPSRTASASPAAAVPSSGSDEGDHES